MAEGSELGSPRKRGRGEEAEQEGRWPLPTLTTKDHNGSRNSHGVFPTSCLHVHVRDLTVRVCIMNYDILMAMSS